MMTLVPSFSLGRNFKVALEKNKQPEIQERKRVRSLGDAGRRIKDEKSLCNGSTMIFALWKQKNGEGKAESKHRGG